MKYQRENKKNSFVSYGEVRVGKMQDGSVYESKWMSRALASAVQRAMSFFM